MVYPAIEGAVFVDRPNRFVAHVMQNGEMQVCHVKNTGRCKELLIPGANVLVNRSDNPARKTALDLVAVWKGQTLINMDSSAPNQLFGEWARAGHFVPGLTLIRPETVHGDSRFDYYLEAGERRIFVEVKGVTLEQDGVARFPDAPSLRAVKHLRGLIRCLEEGYEAWAVFVVQMKGVTRFEPNWQTHEEFGLALRQAHEAGVGVMALDCVVKPGQVTIDKPVPVVL